MIEKITLQSIFDKAWQAFVIEKKNPAFRDGRCWYLTPCGRRCAIGLSLPDDVAEKLKSKEMSFGQVVRENDFCELFDQDVVGRFRSSLDDFQAMLHDDLVDAFTDGWNRPVEHLRYHYIEAARRYNLTIPKDKKEKHEIATGH